MSIERLAEVVSVENDGKILIRILPEMQDLQESDLPFAYPILFGNVKKYTPNVGETILVRISEHWTSFSYDGSKPPVLECKNDSNYPNATFLCEFEKGTKVYVSEIDNSSGFVDKSGTSIKTENSDVKINMNGTGSFELKNSTQSLKSLIDELIDTISSMKTYGSPALHQVSPDDVAKLTILKNKFGALLK